MTVVRITFKDSLQNPVPGILEIFPEDTSILEPSATTIFINRPIPPIQVSGSYTCNINPGRYIFSFKQTGVTQASVFSAVIPFSAEPIDLADIVTENFDSDIATTGSLGLVRIGNGLSVDATGLLSVTPLDTDDVPELQGAVNQWFTPERARAAIAASPTSAVQYNPQTGLLDFDFNNFVEGLGVRTPRVIYVNAEAPPGNDAFDNDGQSELKPYRSLERALLEAAKSKEGTTVHVSPGEYWLDNRPGKTIADIDDWRDDPDEWARTINLPSNYHRAQDASALLRKNALWIIERAYAIVSDRLDSDGVVLTPTQQERCKLDLEQIVSGMVRDVAELGNKHAVASARSYRNPSGDLRYVTSQQISAFQLGLNSIQADAILAVTNRGDVVDPTIIIDETADEPNEYCADIQANIVTLVSIIRTALAGTNDPWNIDITRGIFPRLHWLNPPKVVLDANNNEVPAGTYGKFRDAGNLVRLNRTNLINDAYELIEIDVPNGKEAKCRRDLGYVVDAVIYDLSAIANINSLKAARAYKGLDGNFYTKPDGSDIILPDEIDLMEIALTNLSQNIGGAIAGTYGDPTDYGAPNGDCSDVQEYAEDLVEIVRNTLTSSYNPWADTEVNEGVLALAGGVVVPRGTTFIAPGLRLPIIRPMYIAEDDPGHEITTSVLKLTGESFSFGFTYKDTPGANSTHHKVWTNVPASDDIEMNPIHSAYYYGKVGELFFNDPTAVAPVKRSETVIGAPAGPGDRSRVNTTAGASAYIYNCTLRSDYGMNGMWADGDRMTGFKSFVTAQFTVVSLQRDKTAWQKWDATVKQWVSLLPIDNYYDMKPALYIDYFEGFSDPSQEPNNDDIRVNPRFRHIGFYATDDSFIQVVSCFGICVSHSYVAERGGEMVINNSQTNFGEIALTARGFRSEAFAVDSGLDWIRIIPPKPLTSANIGRFEFSTFNANRTWEYFDNTGLRDRIYLINNFSLPTGFTLKAGTKAYLFFGGLDRSADMVPVEPDSPLAVGLDDQGFYYITVDESTNEIVPANSTLESLLNIDRFGLSVKRVADARPTRDRIYRFVVAADDDSKRMPVNGFIFNTGNGSLVRSSRIFSVYESLEGDFDGQYEVTLLGLNPDGSAQTPDALPPLATEDYDFEPEVDPGTLEITFPVYNPETSITRIIANLILSTTDLGYTAPIGWEQPSIQGANITNIGAGESFQTVQFHRPSQNLCANHTMGLAGLPEYSHGLPALQRIVIPTLAQLFKNRKNIEGGVNFYNAFDEKGNAWAGDIVTNRATGEEVKLIQAEAPIVEPPANFNTLTVGTQIIVDNTASLTGRGLSLPSNGFISINNIRIYFAASPPPTGSFNVSDIFINSAVSEGEPFAWRVIATTPSLVYEPIAGDTQKNLTVTNNFVVAGANSTLNLDPATTGSIQNTSIGNLSRGSGAFTTLTANNAVLLAPTTGTVTIAPTAVGSINGMNIGGSVRGTGAFTSLAANGAVTLNPVNAGVTISPSGTGVLALSSGATGSLNNVAIGGSAPASGAFTTITTSGAASLASLSVAANGLISGNLTVTGNLVVNGGQNIVNTITSTTVDPVLEIGGASSGSLTSNDGNDRGILTTYFDTQQRQAFFGFINPSSEFRYYRQVALTSENKVNVATSVLGNAVFGLVTSGVTVPSGSAFTVAGTFAVNPSSAGALNNTVIGASNPAAATFTSITIGATALLTSGAITRSLLPLATASLVGGVSVGTGLSVSGGVITGRNNVLQVAILNVSSQSLAASASQTFDILTGLTTNSFIDKIEVVVPSGTAGTTAVVEIGEPASLTRYVSPGEVNLAVTDNTVIHPTTKRTSETTIRLRVRNSSSSVSTTSPAIEVYVTYSSLSNFS